MGNLSWDASEDDVRAFFSEAGVVDDVRIIRDRETGRSKGFAFVTMENSEQAIQVLDGKEICARPVRLSQARERPTGR